MGNHAKPPEPSDPGPLVRLLLPLIIGFAVFAFLTFESPNGLAPSRTVSYSEIKDLIRDGEIREATLEATAIVAVLRRPEPDGTERVRAITPQQPDPALLPLLEEMKVMVTAEEPKAPSALLSFLPWIILIGFYIWLSRRMMGGGISGGLPGGIGDFLGGRSSKPTKPTRKVTFADVAGQDQAKREVSELVEFLRDPERFQKVGDGAARYRQDSAGAGIGGRGGCAVLFHFRFGIHRSLRWRGCGPGSQDV